MDLGPWLQRKAWEDTTSSKADAPSPGSTPRRAGCRRTGALDDIPCDRKPHEVFPPLKRRTPGWLMPWPAWAFLALLLVSQCSSLR